MTIAVTGANGQLGTELCRQLGSECTPLTTPDFDLTRRDSIEATLYPLQPSAVINAAAYTAVDKAEQDRETCVQVNADAVKILAEVCRELDCPLVQVSTDYVFEKSTRRTPHTEDDSCETPSGVYAGSKFLGEQFAREWDRHFVVRTCGLYSSVPASPVRGRNFVDTMLSLGNERSHLKVVNDQHCTPTYVPHLAESIRFLLTTTEYGTYHVTNSGATNWCDFAAEIFRLAEIPMELEPITTEQYGAPAPRPQYSVLSTRKYEQLAGQPLPSWKEGLAEYIQQLHLSLSSNSRE